MKNSQHVVPSHDGAWRVRKDGAERATKAFPNERAAVTFAKDIARRTGAAVYVHTSDGSVRARFDYVHREPETKH